MNKQQKNEAFEQLVSEAVNNVGRKRDNALLKNIGAMSHEELDQLLRPQRKKHTPIMTIVRLAAACAAVLVIIIAVGQLDLGSNTRYGNASLFNTYYKAYRTDAAAFDAAGDHINAMGGKSTAAYIEEASTLINKKHSKHDLRRGIALLERLLTYNYKSSLANEIHWYLGLGYLKDNRTDKAKSELRMVIDLEKSRAINIHASDARDILRHIER